MHKTIKDNNTGNVHSIEMTNTCPFCKKIISDNYLYSFYDINKKKLSVTWLCPNCSNVFLSTFDFTKDASIKYTAQTIYPIIPGKRLFEDNINNISKQFVNIYNQSKFAEEYGLTEICGIGYRKALEFLIKDYCIYKNPECEDNIKSSLLGQVIEKYIDANKIKKLAKVSTWLGNDETHYVRIFEDKDITDLKKFIDATVHFISYDLLSDEADKIISDSTK